MIYLIFDGNKLKGFTDHKKEAKKLIERRGGDYRIEKIEDWKFQEIMTDRQNIHLFSLNFYPEYQQTLFGYEANEIFSVLSERFIEIHGLYLDFNRSFNYVKLSEEEEEIIQKFFHIIEMMSDDLMGADSYAPFREYFDIESIGDMVIRRG